MSDGLDTRILSALAHVSIFDVLEHYGADLVGRGTQQIRCPVHSDRSPSARVYGDGNKVYCFKCAKLWDVLTLVQAREKCSHEQALEFVERRFKVPPASENLAQIVRAQLKRHAPLNLDGLFELVEQGVVRLRPRMTLERYNRAWVAFDLVVHRYRKGELDSESAQEQVKAVLNYAQRENV